MPHVRRVLVVSAAIVAIGCGQSSPENPTPTTLHAEAADSAGDAVVVPGGRLAPDLIRSTVDVADGNVTFAIQFVAGTLDRQTTRLTIELDTDQNPSTGIRTGTLGVDFALDLWTARPGQANVQRATPASCASDGPCYTDVAAAPLTIGSDTLTTTVPLSSLGGSAGRLQYRVTAYVSPQPPPTVVADQLPNADLAPAHVP